MQTDTMLPQSLSADSRRHAGLIAGVVGIVVNSAIFCVEIFVGLLTGSIAITSDAFHNLTDTVSSFITIISFKLASKPADKQHPFGHGRIEYLSALLVSMIIMIIGYEFLRTSIQKIINPAPVKFTFLALILVLLAIPAKIGLSLFTRRLGKKINSSTLKATAVDALSDVLILTLSSLSLIVAAFSSVHIDGWLGSVVAVFIMYSGFSIAKNSLSPLIGEPPDPVFVKELVSDLLGYKYITGVHDLVVHNYGPERYMASIHAEVPCDVPVMKLHESIDEAETQLSEKYNVLLVIHMDPLNNNDKQVRELRQTLLKAISSMDEITSIHDFRVVGDGNRKNLIFDAVVDNEKIKSRRDETELRRRINESLQALDSRCRAVVNIDRTYVEL
jgi:cation diffusion facilitator family transporter